MKETLEKLWGEYFAEECALVEGDEERALMRHAAELAEALSASMTKEQREATEKYVEAIYEIQGLFVKKAFLRGANLQRPFSLKQGASQTGKADLRNPSVSKKVPIKSAPFLFPFLK